MSSRFALVFAAAAVFAGPVPAADAPGPLDLARGLREAGLPDIALDYLADLEKTAPADLKLVFPLERAKVRLVLAQQEPDEGARDAAVAGAKAEFQAFLAANPKHPRAAEANLSLARVLSLQAKAQFNRAFRAEDAKKKAAVASTRGQFQQAAKAFGDAAKAVAALLADPGMEPGRKAALTREAYQAELERGINLYNQADTYLAPFEGTEVDDRFKSLAAARDVFLALWKMDANNGVCWAARAWAGICEIDRQNKTAGEDIFKAIRTEAAKNPAGADGVRMVDYFELQTKFLEARGTKNAAVGRVARTLASEWLARDKYKSRMTPERLSVTYYYAHLSMLLGVGEVQMEKLPANAPAGTAPKIRNVPGSAKDLLAAANREYRKLTETDNEYTDRANRDRAVVIRYLVGNADLPPASFTDFEQAQMAAMIQLSDSAGEGRAAKLAKAARLLERARQLALPPVTPKEAASAALLLAYVYQESGKPERAAVLGEFVARTARTPGLAAKGGFLGVQGYLTAMDKLGEDQADAKAVDRDRAVSLALFLDAGFPADPTTDAVRFRLGQLYLNEKQFEPAFAVLGKIGPGYVGAAAARTLEGRAAYLLIAGKESPLSAEQKSATFRKAVADAEAVAEPPASATSAEAKTYLGLRTLLAQLYILNPPDGYAKAEQIAAAAVAKAAAFPLLDENAKKAAGFAADEVRLRAVYAQAVPLYRDGKFEALAERLHPALLAMAQSGPANTGLEGEVALAADALDRFRREVIVLALQGRIRENAVDKAGELFDVLEKLGGTAEATSDALARLVGLVKPQLDELRKQAKAAEADKLAQSVADILVKQSAKPNLSPRVLAFLGRSLRDLGVYDKAVEVLVKVPNPGIDVLKKPFAQQDEKERPATSAFQSAQLELARAYRLSKQLDKADEVLKPALGDAKAPGWAKALDFRREGVFLLEDRAAAAPDADRLKGWKAAQEGWNKIFIDYRNAISKKPPIADQATWERDREKLLPTYLTVFADLQKCLARANTQLLAANPAKLADAYAKIGKSVFEAEGPNAKSITADVKAAYAGLLNDYPAVKDAYTKLGGKAFLPDAQ